MPQFKYDEITRKIIGAAMKVHSALGNGFQEVIYQRAMEIEMRKSGISFVREFNMPIFYDGEQIGERRVDFFVEGIISVELKARELLEKVHYAQARNYLEAYNLEVGLLLNFGTVSLEFKRLENPKYNPNSPSKQSTPSTQIPVHTTSTIINTITTNPRSYNE
jgi:GxxExxY protein